MSLRLRELVHWMLLPLFASIAFAPVLTLWFVGDDFTLLRSHEWLGGLKPFTSLTPFGFYRPLSSILTWTIGFDLFGTNPLPYHGLSLILYCLSAFVFARMVASIDCDRRTGWLAGAVFAVYPLCTEPIAWISSQWDLWAGLFSLSAVWCFAVAWRKHTWKPYIASLAFTVLALLSKESTLVMPLVLPFVALAVESSPSRYHDSIGPRSRQGWLVFGRRAVVYCLPFFLLSLALVGALVRAVPAKFGSAANVTGYQDFIWDAINRAALRVIMPLNESIFPLSVTESVGLLVTLALLAGLVLWGNRRWPLLLLAAAWFIVFLLPLHGVSIDPDTINNRYIYLSLMGFFIAVASVLSGLVESSLPKRISWGIVMGALLLTTVSTWMQLQPYIHSSQETRSIMEELSPLVPNLPGRTLQFDLQNFPIVYKGSYTFWQGFNDAMLLFNKQRAIHRLLDDRRLDPKELQPPPGTGGLFYAAFAVDPTDGLHHLTKLSGTTAALAPVTADHVWSFFDCPQRASAGWLTDQADLKCVSRTDNPPRSGGAYARFTPSSKDGKLLLSGIHLELSGAHWIRLSVCQRLPAGHGGLLGEWFWPADGQSEWGQDSSHAFYLDSTGAWRTYWTYIPVNHLPAYLETLRFDPVNDALPVDIQWMSVRATR